MKYFYSFFLFFFITYSQSNFQDNQNNNFVQKIKNKESKIIVRIENTKESYFFNEDILLNVTIFNNTSQNIRFFIYDNSYKNLSFNQINATKPLERNFNYTAWKDNKTSLSQKKRLLELKQQESFTIKINLKDFFIFKNGNQEFFFEGDFFLNADILFKVKVISFSIKIKNILFEDNQNSKNINTNNSLLIEKWAPHKVIENVIFYQKKSAWKFYFNEIHLPDYLINDYNNTDYYKRFYSSYDNEKSSILEQFKSYLVKNVDYKIKEAEIKKTTIEKDKATVIVWLDIVQYQYLKKINDDFTLKNTWKLSLEDKVNVKKTFNYKLQKIFGYWKVVSKRITIGHIIPDANFTNTLIMDGNNRYFINSEIIETNQNEADMQVTNTLSNNTITNNLIINRIITNKLYYSTDDFIISDQYLPILDNIIDLLNENKKFILKIIGYASLEGSKVYNYELALQRAMEVKNFLIEKGIKEKQIFVISKGNLESTKENNPLDRRVEFNLEIK